MILLKSANRRHAPQQSSLGGGGVWPLTKLSRVPDKFFPFGLIQTTENLEDATMGIGGFPGGAGDKEPACQCKRCKRCEFDPWVKKILWRRAWQPTLVFLSGESYGQKSLVGYGP